MAIKYPSLQDYVNSPEEEIKNITSSFSDHVKLTNNAAYRPRLVFFDFFGDKIFGIVARSYVDETDFKSCIAEMMYSYSAVHAEACVLVLDSTYKSKDSKNVNNCLHCYFVGDKSAGVVFLPYTLNGKEVVWDTAQQSSKEIDLKDHDGVTQEMIELLYAYTHLDKPPFSINDLLSYYTSMHYQFRSFKNMNITYIDYSKSK